MLPTARMAVYLFASHTSSTLWSFANETSSFLSGKVWEEIFWSVALDAEWSVPATGLAVSGGSLCGMLDIFETYDGHRVIIWLILWTKPVCSVIWLPGSTHPSLFQMPIIPLHQNPTVYQQHSLSQMKASHSEISTFLNQSEFFAGCIHRRIQCFINRCGYSGSNQTGNGKATYQLTGVGSFLLMLLQRFDILARNMLRRMMAYKWFNCKAKFTYHPRAGEGPD